MMHLDKFSVLWYNLTMSELIKSYIRAMPYVLSKPNIDSDVYNNALLIQKCANTLKEKGALSKIEEDVLTAYYLGFNIGEISRLLKINRTNVSGVLERITDRLAFVLGDEFSDDSLSSEMENLGYFGEIDLLSE